MDAWSLDRRVGVDSALGDALWFECMDGHDGLSRNGEYRLVLLSRRGDIAAAELLGKPVSLIIDLPGAANAVQRSGGGLLAAGARGRLHRYRVVLRPWTWMLTRRRDSRIFRARPRHRSCRPCSPAILCRFPIRACRQLSTQALLRAVP